MPNCDECDKNIDSCKCSLDVRFFSKVTKMTHTFKNGDRVYYDHGDNDNSDTGTVMSNPEYIPEEGNGIISTESIEVWVLFDRDTPSGNNNNLIKTSVDNLKPIVDKEETRKKIDNLLENYKNNLLTREEAREALLTLLFTKD